MSDTPRTWEKYLREAGVQDPLLATVLEDFDRIERELAEAKARAQHAEGLLECAADMDAARLSATDAPNGSTVFECKDCGAKIVTLQPAVCGGGGGKMASPDDTGAKP